MQPLSYCQLHTATVTTTVLPRQLHCLPSPQPHYRIQKYHWTTPVTCDQHHNLTHPLGCPDNLTPDCINVTPTHSVCMSLQLSERGAGPVSALPGQGTQLSSDQGGPDDMIQPCGHSELQATLSSPIASDSCPFHPASHRTHNLDRATMK